MRLSRPEFWLDDLAATRRDTWLVIAVWFVFVVPLFILRAYHYEEGLAVAIARGAITGGHWIEPHIYGMRFVERPNLLADVVAVLGLARGAIEPWLVRLPTIIALLALALMVKTLVQSESSRAAGTFGALAVLINPMTLQKTVTAEPDLALTALLFWAFCIWWRGERQGGATVLRWVAVGLVLALAGLMKGPQPGGYFAFGVFAYLLLYRRWNAIPGFTLAGIIAIAPIVAWYWQIYRGGDEGEWARYLRMNEDTGVWFLIKDKLAFLGTSLSELMPAALLLPWAIRRHAEHGRRHLAIAVALYAGVCTFVLFLWPAHLATRYAMPALPAFAALMALAYDDVRARLPRFTAAIMVLGTLMALYPIGNGWVASPSALPGLKGRSYDTAQIIKANIAADPAPLYKVLLQANNIFGHLEGDLRNLPEPKSIAMATAPAYVLTRPEMLDVMRGVRGADAFITLAEFNDGGDKLILARMVK
jgi:4-amino-4-deoxy-L-arabinose transferase-like glycosyltransferase